MLFKEGGKEKSLSDQNKNQENINTVWCVCVYTLSEKVDIKEIILSSNGELKTSP